MERVPVAKLKAATAAYLGKVKTGHSLVITDRGQAVAIIEPVVWDSEEDEAMSQLVRSGQVSPPSEKLPDDFFRLPRVPDAEGMLRAFLEEERRISR